MDEFERALVGELPTLRRYAKSLTRDRSKADDLIQDTVARVLAKRHLFRPGTNFRAWLMTIMHNMNTNRVRREARTADANVPLVAHEGIWGFDQEVQPQVANLAGTSDPSVGLLARDITASLEKLPHDMRVVVLLAGQYGMNYAEISEALSLELGTVRSRLSRGRALLRDLCGMRPERHRSRGWHHGPRADTPAKVKIQSLTADLVRLHPDWVQPYAAARAVDSFLSAN